MKRLLVLIFMVFLISVQGVMAENVCLVYFTDGSCGDECNIANSFMEGIINEYSDVLVAIMYDISIAGNTDVFEAYKYNYGISSDVPVVLFGEGDYFSGKSEIFSNTEGRIMDFILENGSNCPLASGSIPSSGVTPDSLPGNPQIFETVENIDNPEEYMPDNEDGIDKKETPIEEIEIDFKSFIENPTNPENFPVWMFVSVIFILLVISLALTYGRRNK